MGTTIRDLEACSKYMFSIGIRDNTFGSGPLSEPYKIETHFSPRARPKQLRVSPSDKIDTIFVSWRASCDLIDTPINYTVSGDFHLQKKKFEKSICQKKYYQKIIP